MDAKAKHQIPLPGGLNNSCWTWRETIEEARRRCERECRKLHHQFFSLSRKNSIGNSWECKAPFRQQTLKRQKVPRKKKWLLSTISSLETRPFHYIFFTPFLSVKGFCNRRWCRRSRRNFKEDILAGDNLILLSSYLQKKVHTLESIFF